MTSDQEREFEHHWPALALRVSRLLRRKKISPWLAEDLTQETGLRLIRMWPKIDQTQPLWPLVATIALNLMRDEMRRSDSHELTYSVPDAPSTENVEQRGMARLELKAVGGALSQMTDKHRHLLLSEVSDAPADAPEPTATRMMRMRARRKLQNLLDHASVLGIALGDHLRRIVREAEIVVTKVLPANAEHVSAAAISLLAALSLGIALTPDTHSEAGEIHNSRGAHVGSPDVGARSSRDTSRDAKAGLDDRRKPGAGSARDRRESDSDRRGQNETDDGSDLGGEDPTTFPGAVNYEGRLNDDTYVYGTIEAEVMGEDDMWQRGHANSPSGAGSINCTIAPASHGAGCSHSGEGWSERGVRANHDGEAVVAGRRVY